MKTICYCHGYTEEQIIAVLKEGEADARVADLCRKYGMNDATYYNWKAKYADMTVKKAEFSSFACTCFGLRVTNI